MPKFFEKVTGEFGPLVVDTQGSHTGAVTGDITGNITGNVTGNVTGGQTLPFLIDDAASYTLVATDSGKIFVGSKSSGTQTYALPAATTAGMEFTFICGNAAGEINVDPGAATYKIQGSGIAVAATKDLKNTAATNVLGDSVTMVSDGVDTWWVTAIQGIWATT